MSHEGIFFPRREQNIKVIKQVWDREMERKGISPQPFFSHQSHSKIPIESSTRISTVSRLHFPLLSPSFRSNFTYKTIYI